MMQLFPFFNQYIQAAGKVEELGINVSWKGTHTNHFGYLAMVR